LDQPVPEGGYLTGQFDFGVSFAEIRSIVLEFVMPDGFDHTVFIVGNSSHSRTLTVLMHETGDPFTLPEWLPAPFHISPGEAAFAGTFFVTDPKTGDCLYGDGPRDCGQRIWQDFVLSGRGNVTFLDTHHSTYNSYSPGVPSKSSVSYGLPGHIKSAFLTIVGTPVPEPNSASVFLFSAALMMHSIRRCRVEANMSR
jgi:hypothetical protein